MLSRGRVRTLMSKQGKKGAEGYKALLQCHEDLWEGGKGGGTNY